MASITIAETMAFLGLAMMVIGIFVTNLMFHRMNWEVEPPKSMRGWLSPVWITSAKSKSVLRRHALMYPESKARIVYKAASVSAIAGCVGSLLSITISVFYTLRGF
jgi:hypothetical protein